MTIGDKEQEGDAVEKKRKKKKEGKRDTSTRSDKQRAAVPPQDTNKGQVGGVLVGCGNGTRT